jgi:hypothetical protein
VTGYHLQATDGEIGHKVHMTLTRAQIKDSPEYDPARAVERAYPFRVRDGGLTHLLHRPLPSPDPSTTSWGRSIVSHKRDALPFYTWGRGDQPTAV